MEFEPTEEDLRQLREWIHKKPHIIQDYDDKFLAGFIRGCKGSLQKTKIFLENFNAMGMRCPEVFNHLDPLSPKIQQYLNDKRAYFLPGKTKDGSHVLVASLNLDLLGKSSKLHSLEAYRYWLMMFYILLWEDNYGPGKFFGIFDIKGASIMHFKHMTPMIFKQLLTIFRTSAPVRLQGVYIINVPNYLEIIHKTFLSLLTPKLAKRVHLVTDAKAIHENIPVEILPKEYGGCQESINVLHNNWRKKVESYRDRLIEESNKMRRLDSIRPKMDDKDEIIGTFRKLNVD